MRSFLENVTIRDKYKRTRKFIPAREEIPYFRLGQFLLRSARSILDESGFILLNVAWDVTAPDPLTVVTSRRVPLMWYPGRVSPGM